MKHFRLASIAGAVALAATLSACGSVDPYGPNNYPVSSANRTEVYQTYPAGSYPYGQYPVQPVASVEWGRVTNVSLISNGQGSYSPNRSAAGGVIGAVVGGLLGNTIGGGSGRAAATVLGAGAGAVVGSNIARNSGGQYNASYPVYRVTVQTDNGLMRTYDVNATGDLRAGDRVRIENGMIYMG
ncbi:MAG: glycine zipper 2TM domain-containing protein [Pseudomonadota bacterium]